MSNHPKKPDSDEQSIDGAQPGQEGYLGEGNNERESGIPSGHESETGDGEEESANFGTSLDELDDIDDIDESL